MPDPQRGRKPKDARTKIIEAAERLYARDGIDAVSIRQINTEAGQRNGSAVHYYFGSRDGLLDAIFASRMSPLNTRRLVLLDELKEASPDHMPPVARIAEVMVRPAFEGMVPGRPTHYRRFLYHMQAKLELMKQITAQRYDLGLRECFRLIRWQMPEIPAPILRQRYMHAVSVMVDSAANMEQLIDEAPDTTTADQIDLRVECTIDSVIGVFQTPVSDRAMALGRAEAERIAGTNTRTA